MVSTTTKLETYNFEYTDTFGGEANYCWVDRGTIQANSLKQALRRAKKELGLTGLKGTTHNHGDMIVHRPNNICTILFIT